MAFVEGFKLGCNTTMLHMGPLMDTSEMTPNQIKGQAALFAAAMAGAILCSPIIVSARIIYKTVKVLNDGDASWTTKKVRLGTQLGNSLMIPIWIIDKFIRACGGVVSSPSYIFTDQKPPSTVERSIPHLLKFLEDNGYKEVCTKEKAEFMGSVCTPFANDSAKFERGADYAIYFGLLENPDRQVLLDVEAHLAEVAGSLTDQQKNEILAQVRAASGRIQARIAEILAVEIRESRRQPLLD